MKSVCLGVNPSSASGLLDGTIDTNTINEKVLLLIIRDLLRLDWKVNFHESHVEIHPPKKYGKDLIRQSMSIKREEIIKDNSHWIDLHMDLARENLANGYDVLDSSIQPVIEVCQTRKQHDLFRILRYHWSSPYSEYVGRRIKIIVRDAGLPNLPVIGIAALGSPIIHIPERDEWIGWNKETRTDKLNYTMDAYVIGAMPPYNYLLGGKLISYLLASREVREIFEKKYKDTKYNKLAGIFTTSLYGRSSQYNRIRVEDRLLYNLIGHTKGYGTLHFTNETFNAMNDFLKSEGVLVSNRFGDGPSWSMRVIRSAGELLGFDADMLLRHSFKREIYYVSLAMGSLDFLNGRTSALRNYESTSKTLTDYWKRRWLRNRKTNTHIIDEVKWFHSDSFEI